MKKMLFKVVGQLLFRYLRVFKTGALLRAVRGKYTEDLNLCYDKLFSNAKNGSLVVSIENIQGMFEMDARSDILRRVLVTKVYEPEFVELIKRNVISSRDAINVGANIGLYTCLMADLVNPDRTVLSIEPTHNAYRLLQSNIIRNHVEKNVVLYNGVVSDSPGRFVINSISGKEEYSSLGEIAHPSVLGQDVTPVEVAGETIDNLVDEYKLDPGILVIDVEGAEYNVLKGATQTIQKFKPIIISELDDLLLQKFGNSSLMILEFLSRNNYKILDVERNTSKIDFPFTGNIIAYPNQM